LNSLHAIKPDLDAALDSEVARIMLVLPTTEEAVGWLHGWKDRRPDLVVVGQCPAYALTPDQMMQTIRSRPEVPSRVVVFTDQLTAAADASLPVRVPGAILYFSGIEALLQLVYHYQTLIWPHRLSCRLAQRNTLPDALGDLIRYLEACYGLGDDWTQRAAQGARRLQSRVGVARRQLRYLESVIFYSHQHECLSSGTLLMYERVRAAYRAVTAHREAVDGVR